MIYTYDCEVFAHDWLVVFKPYLIDDWVIIHNNPTELTNFASTDNIHIGFNSKYYDQFIIKAILGGMDMEDVKGVNDWIINGDGTGWDYPPLQELGFIKFNNVDIMTDMQKGLSLKAIEGHLGLSVKESDVPFDLPRPLTKA